MDAESQKMLEAITAKQVGSLTEGDIAILRARRSYLSEASAKAFASVLEDKVVYSNMKNDELLALLAERKIVVPETAKKKADFIALLEADDEAK